MTSFAQSSVSQSLVSNIARRSGDRGRATVSHEQNPRETINARTRDRDNETADGEQRCGRRPGSQDKTPSDGKQRCSIADDEFHCKPPGEEKALQECSSMVEAFDLSMCQNQQEEIDTLLVFAGLFSGILTAFISESYKWMIEQPEDMTAIYLRHILAHMKNVTSIPIPNDNPIIPNSTVSLINSLWFSSLTLSLTSALVGIVSKQWLREYLRGTGRSHQTSLAVRQLKYDGFTAWWVGPIIAAIPLLLQAALALFLVGMLELLWHLDKEAARLVSFLASGSTIFFIATTTLPAIQYLAYHRTERLHTIYQVPFKSAQAWLFFRTMITLVNAPFWLYDVVASLCKRRPKNSSGGGLPYQTYPSWSHFDLDWTFRRDQTAEWNHKPTTLGRCLGFIQLNFEHHMLRDWLWNCLWHMRRRAVDAIYVLQCARRDPDTKIDFSLPADALAHEVLPLLDPSKTSHATSELVLHILLTTLDGIPRKDTCTEHLLRVLNTLLRQGTKVRDVPVSLFGVLQVAIRDLGDSSIAVLRRQLCFTAQDLLRYSKHDKQLYDHLTLIYEIVLHLDRYEPREDEGGALSQLGSDLAGAILEWLSGLSTAGVSIQAYTPCVLWSAQTTVVISKWMAGPPPSRIGGLVQRPSPAIFALVEFVGEVFASIPPDTLPIWAPEDFDRVAVQSVLDDFGVGERKSEDEGDEGAEWPDAGISVDRVECAAKPKADPPLQSSTVPSGAVTEPDTLTSDGPMCHHTGCTCQDHCSQLIYAIGRTPSGAADIADRRPPR